MTKPLFTANPDMSAHMTPVLTNVFVHTEQLCKHISKGIRPLAREARIVLSVRLASSLSNPRIPRSSSGRVSMRHIRRR